MAIIAVVALAVPSAAGANYYYSKDGAQRIAKDYVYKHYGYSRYATFTICRPQGSSRDTSYLWHRWVCGWVHGDCSGAVNIIGSSAGPGSYYARVWSGEDCSG
jgi:hypothetical protein